MTKRPLAALTGLVLLLGAPAAAELVQPADDRRKTAAAGWWVYTGVPREWIERFVASHDARITDLRVATTSPMRFDVVLVRNTGSYATPWWWYTDLTVEQAHRHAIVNQARIVSTDVYDTPAGTRVAVAMARGGSSWWWYVGTTAALTRKLAERGSRLVALASTGDGRWVATMVANTRDREIAWWWYTHLPADSVAAKVAAHDARIVDLERNADGTWNVVLYERRGIGWSWAVDEAPVTLRDRAAREGQRIIDFQTYESRGTRYAAAVTVDASATKASPGPNAVSYGPTPSPVSVAPPPSGYVWTDITEGGPDLYGERFDAADSAAPPTDDPDPFRFAAAPASPRAPAAPPPPAGTEPFRALPVWLAAGAVVALAGITAVRRRGRQA